MNITSGPTNILSTSDIILITTTIFTAIASLADLLLNTYVAHKKRHFQSTCCVDFCTCIYDSEVSDPEDPLKKLPEKGM